MPAVPAIDGINTMGSPHPVCGPGEAYDRNGLHKAVCDMDLLLIQSEIAKRPAEFLQRKDSKGYCPIHTASSLCMKDAQNSKIASDIVRMLTNAGAENAVTDSEGNTPLHYGGNNERSRHDEGGTDHRIC